MPYTAATYCALYVVVHLQIKFIKSGREEDFSKPRYAARFSVDELLLRVRKDQFDNIIDLNKIMEQYQKLQFE